ncbi:hypothetical protein PIB30_105416, partial [Stylosanthes scabra]|nr:hypothetical protein [Stylosanthes scabra]
KKEENSKLTNHSSATLSSAPPFTPNLRSPPTFVAFLDTSVNHNLRRVSVNPNRRGLSVHVQPQPPLPYS